MKSEAFVNHPAAAAELARMQSIFAQQRAAYARAPMPSLECASSSSRCSDFAD